MSHIIDKEAVPSLFPTHRHDPAFWEMLGRTVATYGFLEEILGKAIFILTGTKNYSEAEIDAAYEKWLPILERALSNPLHILINEYVKSVKEHPSATIESIEELKVDLRKAADLRNVLCHSSWRAPDARGFSVVSQFEIYPANSYVMLSAKHGR